MNLKVLSIFNNAKVFLDVTEILQLAKCIETEFGDRKKENRIYRKTKLPNWSIEEVTEKLLATRFKN